MGPREEEGVERNPQLTQCWARHAQLVSDFGLARELAGGASFVQTTRVAGTDAFLDPEYEHNGGELRLSSDVYREYLDKQSGFSVRCVRDF